MVDQASKSIETYRRAFLLGMCLLTVLAAFLWFPRDDGLRHVGLAFGDFASWGTVYPFSTFEKLKDYDPWFGYDHSLRIIARLLSNLPVPELTLKFLVAKVLLLLFTSVFFYLTLSRSGLLDEVRDKYSLLLAPALCLFFLSAPYLRTTLLRPFAFGTFFLLYSIGKSGILQGTLSSMTLSFFYPYLSWFYIIPVAFAHFFKGSRRFAVGALGFLIPFLVLQPPSFWKFQTALFTSALFRSAIHRPIVEFTPSFLSGHFYLVLAGFLIMYPKFSQRTRKLNCASLLLLIYLVPGLQYVRYYLDLILPLFFVCYAREISILLKKPLQDLVSNWRNLIYNEIIVRIRTITKWRPQPGANETKESDDDRFSKLRRSLIAAVYLVVLLHLVQLNQELLLGLKTFCEGLKEVPESSRIVSSFTLQYKTLFVRPDLRIIPSCELGFSSPEIREEYEAYFNEGLVVPLMEKTGVQYLIENRDVVIDPQEGSRLKRVTSNDQVRVWKLTEDGEMMP